MPPLDQEEMKRVLRVGRLRNTVSNRQQMRARKEKKEGVKARWVPAPDSQKRAAKVAYINLYLSIYLSISIYFHLFLSMHVSMVCVFIYE